MSKFSCVWFLTCVLCIGVVRHAFAQSETADTSSYDSPYGVLDFLPWDHDWNAHHYPLNKVKKSVELMKEAGVGYVRMDFLWTDIEPKYRQYDFSKYDSIVNLLSAHDIKILGLLNYNNDVWASDNWNDAPDPKKYLSYVKTVVYRYKDTVKHWEIWNEPNFDTYWKPQDGMKRYTEILKEVYVAIKEIDPQATVVLGGLAGNAAQSLEQIYEQGGKDSFDVVNFHPFTSPISDPQMEKAKALYDGVYQAMIKYGDSGKPIWLTEIGCPGVPHDGAAQNWWMGKNPDEQTQSHWVGRVMQYPLTWPNVKKVFWAFFRDTPNHFQSGTDYFGLLREDFSPKPSYDVYKRIAKHSENNKKK